MKTTLFSLAALTLLSLAALHLQGQSPASPAAAQAPSTPGRAAPAATAPAAVPAVESKPAAEKPATSKPAAEKPAAEKPAAEKPAAEKPAAEKPAASPASPSSPSAPRTANKPIVKQPNFTGPGVVMVPHGLVTAFDDIRVPAREPGTLITLQVRGGEQVRYGDILGEIDNRDALAKRKIAEGELTVATTQAESTAELEAAQKAAEVSKVEMDQNVQIRLKNPDAVSDLDMRRSRFQYDRALAQIKVAEVDRVVAQLTTVVKGTQVEAADNELERRRIHAPQNGVVVEVFKHVGEWVQPGEAIMRVVRLDRVRVEGFVLADEATPSDVAGKPVEVTVHLSRGKTEVVRGVISFVSPLVEGTGRSRQFRVWAEVENRQIAGHYVIQPGASADLRIDTAYEGQLVPATDVKPGSAPPGSPIPGGPPAIGPVPGAAGSNAPGNWKPVTTPGAAPSASAAPASATPSNKPIAATAAEPPVTTLKPVAEQPLSGGAVSPSATGQLPGAKRGETTDSAVPNAPAPAAPLPVAPMRVVPAGEK